MLDPVDVGLTTGAAAAVVRVGAPVGAAVVAVTAGVAVHCASAQLAVDTRCARRARTRA